MATKETWASRVRQDSDATYQEWRDEFITKLGLLVTGGYLAADETNITPGAGSRASANSEQGYAVYHLNDSLHGTAPVYIRFGFGSGSANTNPRIQVTVGTSTNGSGVLGGTALSTITTINSNASAAVDTTRNSYFCALPGFLGISWKQVASQEGSFFFCRTVDSTGAISATGGIGVWGSGGATGLNRSQSYRFAATAAAYSSNTGSAFDTMLGFFPQKPSNTLTSGNIQAAVGWTITPAVAPLVGVCGVLDAEVTAGTTFSVALVGSASRTYIALSSGAGPFGPASSASSGYPKFAMLWE